jgi:hypothetical protein
MRSSAFLFCLLLCISASAQPAWPYQDGRITYQDVVQVPGATSDALIGNAVVWIAKHLGENQTPPISYGEQTTISATGSVEINTLQGKYPSMARLSFHVAIETKSGRYRYTLSSFQLQAIPTAAIPSPPVYPLEEYENAEQYDTKTVKSAVKQNAVAAIEGLIESLRQHMSKASSASDW